MSQGHATTERRIAAGDWVRMTGLSPSLRGLGKVVDADYDPKDGAMRAACVDMGAREYWIPVAELSRVQPDEEARLAQLARDRGLVDEERAPERARRLERTLEAVRQGTASYVRSPGLLDLLWPFTSHADPDHGSRALSGLFDDALDVLVAARLERVRVVPPAPPPTWERVADTWTGNFPASEVVPRLLSQLDRMALVRRAEAMGVDLSSVRDQSTEALRAHVAQRAGVAQVLDALWRNQLREACRDGLGMPDADALSGHELRERVLGFVERASRPVESPRSSAPIDPTVLNAVTTAARAEAARALSDATARVVVERQRRLLPAAAPHEVLPRILNTLHHASLIELALANGLTGVGSRRALADAIAAGVTLGAVLAHLEPHQLRLACGAVGLTGVIDGDADALRARLLAVATSPPPSS